MLKSITILSTIFLLIVPSSAHSSDKIKDEWEVKFKKIQDLFQNDPDGCNKVFHMLWNDAKQGNLNARNALLYEMTIMHGPDMLLPGGTPDLLTRRRQYIVMAAYSIGSDIEKTADGKYYPDMVLQSMMQMDPKEDFAECLQKSRSPECVKLLEEDFLPTFDEFAREIDTFIKAGHKAKCVKRDNH